MRKMILAAVAVLGLSACGGGGSESEANQANGMTTDNMMLDPNMTLDQNGMGGMNGMNGMAPMDGNAAGMDANTQNMMQQDATTNDPDTNLANGI